MSAAGLFTLGKRPEPIPSMREMMLIQAKKKGQKTAWMDGKEYAVIGSGKQKKEEEMRIENKSANSEHAQINPLIVFQLHKTT